MENILNLTHWTFNVQQILQNLKEPKWLYYKCQKAEREERVLGIPSTLHPEELKPSKQIPFK